MEIERKFLPASPSRLPTLSSCEKIEMVQAYLNASPILRIRKEGEDYFLTYKGKGMITREEYNLPLNADAFSHLLAKCDGNTVTKTRYRFPLPENNTGESLTAEIDIFSGQLEGLILIEVEFSTPKGAEAFLPPAWFGKEVSLDRRYHNISLSKMDQNAFKELLSENDPAGECM